MTALVESFEELSPEQIAACEEQLGVSLPESYKEFLLAQNGGHLPGACFLVPECGWVSLGILYGICSLGQPCDLYTEQEHYRDFDLLPPGIIVIGNDPGNNKLLLDTNGEARGYVYYWDAVNFFPASSEEDGNTYFLAKSIQRFLENLGVGPEGPALHPTLAGPVRCKDEVPVRVAKVSSALGRGEAGW